MLVDGEYSEKFSVEQGVRQGCPISPILFSVFVNGLIKEMREKVQGGVKVGDRVVQMLLFADDVVLLAESPEQLQEMLDVLCEYSRNSRKS